MTEPVLKAQSLSKSFRQGSNEIKVLKNVNLEVARGHQVAIVGASGTGKSTLLHLLGGLDFPSEGSVELNGKNLSQLNEADRGKLRNRLLGFVYQFHHLLPEFSALENVMMPLLVRRMRSKTAKEQAAEILSKVSLYHRLNHKPSELSGGERQRAAIARALVINPICILADEPTGNIDRENAKGVQELFLQLNRDMEVSTVVATHDMQLAASMNRIYKLVDGSLVLIDESELE